MFRNLKNDFPDQVGAHLMFDDKLPRLIFAGADMVVLPSRFEPCGLVQMEAMRYGAVPIVRAVGGLADTVKNFNPEEDEGWGFVFHDFNPWAYFAQLVRALEVYRHKKTWRKLQKRAMKQDNSWEARASDYVEFFRKAVALRQQDLVEAGRISPEEASAR